MNNKKAFTLIELSIVLVIIGLLVGGVMGGQALIQQAKLQKLGTQISQYGMVIDTFKMQYNALPGDMSNASSFWDCSGLPEGCNGDNDGTIRHNTKDVYLFWYHLSQAGLIEGKFTGKRGPILNDPGVNCPIGPLGSCFGARYSAMLHDSNINYNALEYGHLNSSGFTASSIISPKDAFTLLTKFDDGRAESGKILIMAGGDTNLAGEADKCASKTTGVLNTSYDGIVCRVLYNIDR